MPHVKRMLAALLAPLLFACSDPNNGDDAQQMMPPPAGVTYQKDVRALVEDKCLACHVPGGIGPFALDSYQALVTYAPTVVGAVESGLMPPWLPDPSCRHYQAERLITPAQIAVFRAWMEEGMIEGDPADYVPTRGSGLSPDIGAPTLTLSIPAPYTPNAERPDDYRCFVMDHEFPAETYLRTSNVLPDQRDLVHHVILYLVPPQYVSQVEALDAAEAGPGYTCFGGVGAGQPQPIAGWVPGTPIAPGSDDAAVRIPAGSKIVMQMHYNTLAGPAVPDRSSIQMWFLPGRPTWLLRAVFFPYLGLDIPAGDASSHQTREFVNTDAQPWTIVSTAPHMHLLGTRLKTTKIATDGREECVIDVPRWDFNWQQGYLMRPGETLIVNPGEKLRLECWYDNSAANQPVVNGVQLEPTEVWWGERTLDEMCLNTLVMVEPYSPLPPQGTVCPDFQACYDQCRTTAFPTTGCILQCLGDDACAQCVLGGVIACTSGDCGVQADGMLGCFDDCAGQGDTCIFNSCTDPIPRVRRVHVALDRGGRVRHLGQRLQRPALRLTPTGGTGASSRPR